MTLATTLLLGTFYFAELKNYPLFLLFGILAGLTKEQVWLIIALVGLLVMIAQKKVVFGLLTTCASLAVFYVPVWQVIPQTRGSHHFALSYYSEFGATPQSIVKAAIFHPSKTLGTITPFVFISSIYGVKTIRLVFPNIYKFTIYYLLLCMLPICLVLCLLCKRQTLRCSQNPILKE